MQLDTNLVILAVLAFVTAMLLVEGSYFLWQGWRGPEARRLRSRLDAVSEPAEAEGPPSVIKERVTREDTPLEKLALRLPRAPALDRLLVQSGLSWTVGRVLLFALTGALALGLLALRLLESGLYVVAAAVAGALLPMAYIVWKRSRHLRHIEAQLPDALDLIGRGLRAGHAFTSTLKMAGEELPEPIATEFRTTYDEINFGVSLEEALMHLADRIPSTDLRYFVVAVLIQRESGGNLAEVLANLARLIRERLRLLSRVRVLSAEGRLSAWILGLMPFVLGGIMALLNPEFISRLWTDPWGIALVKAMLVLMVVGVLLLRKIIRIHV